MSSLYSRKAALKKTKLNKSNERRGEWIKWGGCKRNIKGTEREREITKTKLRAKINKLNKLINQFEMNFWNIRSK